METDPFPLLGPIAGHPARVSTIIMHLRYFMETDPFPLLGPIAGHPARVVRTCGCPFHHKMTLAGHFTKQTWKILWYGCPEKLGESD